MSYLTLRAEQALLGALVADQDPPEQLRTLEATDFGGREHRVLYTDIMTVRRDAPTLRGEALIDAVARYSGGSGEVAWYLRGLRDQCPDPQHVLSYAQLVQASAFRRDAAAHADRIMAEAARAPRRDSTKYAERLATALEAQARRFEALTTVDRTEIRIALGAPPVPEQHSDPRARREDELLADLMQNPRQARDLAGFLPAESFTDPQREEVYRTVLVLAADGDPIDEVIVGWQMAKLRAIASSYGADIDDRPPPIEPDDVYLSRLAAMTPETSAVQIGAGLVTEDIRTHNSFQTNTIVHALNPPETAARPVVTPLDPSLGSPRNNNAGPSPRLGR
ncbi:DnaB-like helicase N-terminal domain-containing protein [Cryptosporangium sp. NPDC048952]|uniref:DnaB-like helicase N-terminal domain-containing protein n=1 Tax=Cryptosporangium sp. NPDC048952 TaxID=3363961 RepID=UPI003712C712